MMFMMVEFRQGEGGRWAVTNRNGANDEQCGREARGGRATLSDPDFRSITSSSMLHKLVARMLLLCVLPCP